MTKSIPKCNRTFKCWLIELRNQCRKLGAEIPDVDLNREKMFYFGGYSPKMVIYEELKIPIGWEEV